MAEISDEYVGRLVLGRYRIVRVIARGGMGVIYLARSEGAAGFVKPVVVKRILADLVLDEGMVRMFKREARIMSNLRHPGVVSVIDFGQERNAYFMVLDYVHGFHLGRWYRYMRANWGAFPTELAIHIVVQVLDALHYAHSLISPDGSPLRIVHRDVTPSNVLIDVHGHVCLADFGIAQMRTDTTEFRTSETTIKGKFPYIPPEVFRGAEPTAQSDVYAAAVVLHEILIGKNEFRTKDVSSTIVKVLQHMPTPVSLVRPDAPVELDAVLSKALCKDVEERYADAAEFAQALREVRKMSADEADLALSKATRRDFLDVRMAELFQVPQLSELENAWRNPPPEPPSPQNETLEALEDDAPVIELEVPASQQPQIGRLVWLMVGLGVLIITLAVGVSVWVNRTPTNTPVILYRGAFDPADGTQREPSADPQPKPTKPEQLQPAQTPVSTPDKTPPRPKPQNAFSRAFAERSAEFEACFEQHPEAISGETKVSVEMEIDVEGHVVTATLRPNTLAASVLGKCVLRVAKGTRFPQQKSAVTVRIPLTTRRMRTGA